MSIRRKYIEEGWNNYSSHVIPKDAGSIQRRESRRSFFAGSITTFNALVENLNKESEVPTKDEIKIIEDLSKELDDYLSNIKAGKE